MVCEVIAPVLTPFAHGAPDLEVMRRHVTAILEQGVDAVFVCGTTGLGPSLSFQEKVMVLRSISDVTNRIIVQIGGLNMDEVIGLVKECNERDIMGVASFAPYYYQRLPESHLLKYFQNIVELSEHPVYIYNYPAGTGKDLDPNFVSKLSVAGIKDTSESLVHSLEYRRKMPSLKVYNGSDFLAAISLLVLDGTVASAANFVPKLFFTMKRGASKGQTGSLLKAQFLIDEIVELGRKYGYLSSIYDITSYFMGYDVRGPRSPIFPLGQDEREQLLRQLVKLKEQAEEMSE
ncbi:MAG: dihydrodipicolinate synthase family protein [TACK group archaeon]|nr:dihydrodipicolinate synthase family protein [TACK group archaeon]